MNKITVGYECLNCFVAQIDKIVSSTEENEEKRKKLFLKLLNFLSGIDNFNVSPPEIARQLYKFIRSATGVDDPYMEIKEITNKISEKVMKIIFSNNKAETLEDFIKYSVAGNIIDFGVGKNRSEYSVEKLSEILLNFTLDYNDTSLFEKEIKNSKILLYILDNSGEAVFDRYLVNFIKNIYSELEIIIAARNDFIINDITVKDALKLNFQEIGKIVSTGYNGPGVVLEQCSKEFCNIFNSADIIISKGQGNFETLWGNSANIFYALKIKCKHVADTTGFRFGANLFLSGKNYDKS